VVATTEALAYVFKTEAQLSRNKHNGKSRSDHARGARRTEKFFT